MTRLLGGLRWVLSAPRMYWVHALYVINLIVLTSLVWWGLWYQRDSDWNYLTFAYNLFIGPGVLYYIGVVLVPEVPRRVRNWRDYFENVRRLFYSALLGLVIATFIGGLLITGTPLLHPSQALILLAAILAVTGLLSTRHAVHGTLAVAMTIVVGCSVVLAALAPYSE